MLPFYMGELQIGSETGIIDDRKMWLEGQA